MGSLSSRPKAPAQVPAQVVYYTPQNNDGSSPEEPDDQEVSKARAENVLRRNRSVLGNVLTSFRGVLSQSGNGVARKTLLGE